MQNDIRRIIKINKIKYVSVFIILLALIFVVAFFSVNMGEMKTSFSEILEVIQNKLFGVNSNLQESVITIIWNIRIPRIICGCFVGAGLAVSGVIFQGILQNTLADPYTLGISTGASFGASIAIILNILNGIYFPTTIASLIGAFTTLFLVIIIARKGNGFESSNLIIAGIIISSILSSGVSFTKMLSGENVSAIVFWIMGSLSAKGWGDVSLIMPTVTIGTIISTLLAKKLDIMALGDDNAKSLGVNADRVRFIYLIIGSSMTAICVSICGVIGFIGLIVPHLLRFWITAKNSQLIPLSAMFGAVLLMVSDNASRIFSSGEIPVGVITTIIGGPFFIFIFTRRKR